MWDTVNEMEEAPNQMTKWLVDQNPKPNIHFRYRYDFAGQEEKF